jgi:hypothetical protein
MSLLSSLRHIIVRFDIVNENRNNHPMNKLYLIPLILLFILIAGIVTLSMVDMSGNPTQISKDITLGS